MAWGRRRRQSVFGDAPKEKSVLGGTHLGNAKAKIEGLCQCSVLTMAPFQYDMKTVLPWCFSADTLQTLTHAHELVEHNQYGWGVATRGAYRITEGETLNLDFTKVPMLAPIQTKFNLTHTGGMPLWKIIEEIQKIKRKFDMAAHVLSWLDEHATAGAMRYYWPTVLSLAPAAPAMSGEMPSRFNTPDHITSMLPLIRDSATTIASALLLANVEDRPDKGMSLVISSSGMKIGEYEFSPITRTFCI